MFVIFFKNFMIFLLCLYVIYLFTNKDLPKLLTFIFSLLLATESVFLKHYSPEVAYVLPALSLFLLVSVVYSLSFRQSLSIVLCSFGINLILYAVTAFSIALITLPFRGSPIFNLKIVSLCTSLLYPVFLISIMKGKRIHNNLQLLVKPPAVYITVLFSIIGLSIATLEQTTTFDFSLYRYVRIGLILFIAFVLILWWRAQITKSYRERLRILEVESLRASKVEQEKYIAQLEQENERMGRIIHKDNRIVNAMADSVTEYLQSSAFLSGDKLAEKGNALLAQIFEIRSDRQVLLDAKTTSPTALPQMGYAGIDAIITYMSKEAAENKINFQFHYGENFFTDKGKGIQENDIVHLLSDSLENAIIATKFAGGKSIELSMLTIKGIPTISISDSGIPFELDTYMNLGIQKASTHLNTGGSGIGLMDLWELKEKYKATLYIDEHPKSPDMTKRVVYIFDKKNRYIISTNRFKELQQKQARADMFVVNPNTEAVI